MKYFLQLLYILFRSVFSYLRLLSLFQSVFISSINSQTPLYSYLDSPSISSLVDRQIAKQILGMLWGKYNRMSCSQLLDHALKDNPPWPYGKVLEKALVFTTWTENLDLCLMRIPLQWCKENFYSKTPPVFLFSDFHCPFLFLVCISIHHKVHELSGFMRNTAVNVRIYIPKVQTVFIR